MKITKEKVIYFLSSSSLPFILCWFLIFKYLNLSIARLPILFFIGGILVFINSYYRKNKKYNFIYNAFLVVLPLAINFILSVYFSDKSYISVVVMLYIFLSLFNIIIMLIIDPLRKKIKW